MTGFCCYCSENINFKIYTNPYNIDKFESSGLRYFYFLNIQKKIKTLTGFRLKAMILRYYDSFFSFNIFVNTGLWEFALTVYSKIHSAAANCITGAIHTYIFTKHGMEMILCLSLVILIFLIITELYIKTY